MQEFWRQTADRRTLAGMLAVVLVLLRRFLERFVAFDVRDSAWRGCASMGIALPAVTMQSGLRVPERIPADLPSHGGCQRSLGLPVGA